MTLSNLPSPKDQPGATEEAYTHWIKRYILFYNQHQAGTPFRWRHPAEMGDKEIAEFLTL